MSNHIITISRQYGSGGRFIGKLLAEKMQIPLYDNELITLAAKKSGYSEAIFENVEKTATHSLLYSLSMFGSTAGVYGLPLSDKVFIVQSEIIKKVAAEGPCVIIGRCADFVLKDEKNIVDVFVHSDMEHRIKRAVTYYGIAEEKAKEMITKTDKRRASYYNYYTGHRWGEANNYEISLNSDRIGIEKCVDILHSYITSIN